MIVECLTSLKNQTYPAEIVVVDNGSIDESVHLIESHFDEVVILKNKINKGFAGGVNTGITYALENDADAVALFNNDAVAEQTWLGELVKEIEANPQTGIVTGKLMRSDKTHLDSTGDYYSTWGIPFPRGRNQKDTNQYEAPGAVFAASGGASLYRTELFKEIGMFDERFFAYYEDVDISFRAQLAGWNVSYTPKAIAYHHIGSTSSKLGDFTRYHSIKNFLILYTKDMPAQLYWKYLPTYLYQFMRTTARSILDGKFHVWLHSVATFIVMIPGILTDRRSIQKQRKISSSTVKSLLHTGRPPTIPTL